MEFLWAISVSLLLSFIVVCNGDEANASPIELKTFIVSVQNDGVPPNFENVEDWYKSLLSDISPSSTLLYSYSAAFHGFAASLTAGQAQRLQAQPAVLHVFEDRLFHLHTTRTPEFLGLNYISGDRLVNGSDEGSSVIIGLLDSGIWPERRSFSDHDLPAVPKRWKGKCEGGANFPKSLCNKKLVGVRYFNAGLKSIIKKIKIKDSARDDDGHGTHTASTAAGRAVGNSSFFGLAAGVASGIAPKARIAVYRVCYEDSCASSDILAGMDKAIADNVDILSISLGGDNSTEKYSVDAIAIGGFAAVEKGIFVSTSAGNSGPTPASLSNTAPWLSTIGAGGIDRNFPADLVLATGEVIEGVSLYNGEPLETKFYPLTYNNAYCSNLTIGSDKIKGKIVVCDQETTEGPYFGRLLRQKGSAGTVMANGAADGEGLIANPYDTPGLDIPYSQTKKLLSYINSTEAPMGKMRFHGTVVGVKPAPEVAFFSSRGPNPTTRFVLKPDVIAPGLNILAAWPYNVTSESGDTRITEFSILSGTSMSCPHVSGIAALLKSAHPKWSPAMIRSALITTAYLKDRDSKPLKDQFSGEDATIWDTGAGHVDPKRANDPGLVYDVKIEEYIDFLCASNYSEGEIKVLAKRKVSCSGRTSRPWDLNYPAIVVDSDGGSAVDVVAKRAVTNVGTKTLPVTYKVEVKNPRGTTVIVDPPELKFSREFETRRFEVWIKGEKNGSSWFDVGGLIWSDGNHTVSSPIVVQWGHPFQS